MNAADDRNWRTTRVQTPESLRLSDESQLTEDTDEVHTLVTQFDTNHSLKTLNDLFTGNEPTNPIHYQGTNQRNG